MGSRCLLGRRIRRQAARRSSSNLTEFAVLGNESREIFCLMRYYFARKEHTKPIILSFSFELLSAINI
jgi:hypothetical protein